MTHTHVVDPEGGRKPCLELNDKICITRTTGGYLVHFDAGPPGLTSRAAGGITVGPGHWEQVSGSFETRDLTIKPSIKISERRDGADVVELHGWIRDGGWVYASESPR